MTRRLLLPLLILLLTTAGLRAQQIVEFSQFRENAFFFNPAVAGSENNPMAYLSGRMQWTNIDRSPFTVNAAFHMPFDRKNIAAGGYLFNDFTGPTSQTAFGGSFAYRIIFSEDRPGVSEHKSLSFGLGVSVVQHRLRGDRLRPDIPDDPEIISSTGSQFFPDASFGIFYNSKKLYAGLAVPQLISVDISVDDRNDTETTIRRMQHYYALFGGKIHLNKKARNATPLYLDGAFNLHYVIGAPPQVTTSLRFEMEDTFFAGVGYRSIETLFFEAGFTISEQFRLNYSYDLGVSDLRPDLGQVHEIFLGYRFAKSFY